MNIIDFASEGFDNREGGAYKSQNLKETVKTKQYCDLEKTRYIKDIKERLKKVRELLPPNIEDKDNPQPKVKINFKKLGFKTFNDYLEVKQLGMFCGIWNEIAIKRQLEIECYTLDLYNTADELGKTDEYKAICFLIDEKYKNHTGIFDNEIDDKIYNDEYNELIFDLLQNKINEISKIEITPIAKTIIQVTKKPLVWNANKNTIGTLFGLLIDSGIIKGTKQDLSKGLCAMFSDLSESTILDNLNLKINSTDSKTLYDVQTETILKPWIDYLKIQKKKKENSKSTKVPK